MAIIYVPLNPSKKVLEEVQRTTLGKFIDKGWKHEGIVQLKDIFGTEISVAVLKKE